MQIRKKKMLSVIWILSLALPMQAGVFKRTEDAKEYGVFVRKAPVRLGWFSGITQHFDELLYYASIWVSGHPHLLTVSLSRYSSGFQASTLEHPYLERFITSESLETERTWGLIHLEPLPAGHDTLATLHFQGGSGEGFPISAVTHSRKDENYSSSYFLTLDIQMPVSKKMASPVLVHILPNITAWSDSEPYESLEISLTDISKIFKLDQLEIQYVGKAENGFFASAPSVSLHLLERDGVLLDGVVRVSANRKNPALGSWLQAPKMRILRKEEALTRDPMEAE
jgi:hypothetical protein